MKTKYVFAKHYVDVKPVLEKAVSMLKGRVGIITTVQFMHLMKEVKEFIQNKGFECEALGQVLGCTTKVTENYEADTILFFGDGLFHPKAMAIQGKKKQYIILADPISTKVRELTQEEQDVFEQRRMGGLAKFYTAKNIGVLITLKPGQEQVKAALKLKEQFPDKNIYELVFDDLNWSTLEDFPFIECFINTMCPRIAYDDYNKVPRPIVDYLDLMEMEANRNDKKIIIN